METLDLDAAGDFHDHVSGGLGTPCWVMQLNGDEVDLLRGEPGDQAMERVTACLESNRSP